MRRFVGRFIFRCDGRISLRSKELELLTNIDTHVCTRGIYFSYRLSFSPQLPLFVRPRSSRLASLEDFSWRRGAWSSALWSSAQPVSRPSRCAGVRWVTQLHIRRIAAAHGRHAARAARDMSTLVPVKASTNDQYYASSFGSVVFRIFQSLAPSLA